MRGAMLRYIELKTGHNDNGPAWIASVTLSRSGQTVYFDGRALKKCRRGVYYDLETREEFWISGVKKNGNDRHWAGSGKVMIEETVVVEYLALTGASVLDKSRLVVIPQ